MELNTDKTNRIYRLLGKLEYLAIYLDDNSVKSAYEDLCYILDHPSVFGQQEEKLEDVTMLKLFDLD